MKFTNTFIQKFQQGPDQSNQSRQVNTFLYSHVMPTPVKNPKILCWSDDLSRQIGLTDLHFSQEQLSDFFSGNQLLAGMKPYATRYGGHQFGHWAGQLGDGRAIYLGEIETEKKVKWEIQLKGAGPTPYSRRGDGRAVLRSSLREYICSESMHFLGVPTTRALCCLLTGETVVRDMFYDGHPEQELGAITTRLAPSFLRFGHFEILAAHGELDNLKALIEFAITEYFPEIAVLDHNFEKKCLLWFRQICEATASLIAQWTRVGFVHGVMNTDNLSILGLTIDYGPYGWLDVYEPDWTPNTSDSEQRRYRFENQPSIAYWNLGKLANALGCILSEQKALEEGLQLYREKFSFVARSLLFNKIGFQQTLDIDEKDETLLLDLDEALRESEIDFTIFYRLLSEIPHLVHGSNSSSKESFIDSGLKILSPSFYEQNLSRPKLSAWIQTYRLCIQKHQLDPEKMKILMNQTNPVFIPRNFFLHEVIEDLTKGHSESLSNIINAMKTPYEENEHTKPYFIRRPDWARHKPGCSMLSCSS